MNLENKPNSQESITNSVPVNNNNNNVLMNNDVSGDGQQVANVEQYMQGTLQNVSSVENSASSNASVMQAPSAVGSVNINETNAGDVSVSGIIMGQKNKIEELTEKTDEVNEVTKVLSSSFDNKNKVNLLTTEQKAELMKKREEARQEKENYQPVPVSKFKRVMSVIFIVVLFLVVLFLPEINGFVLTLMNSEAGKVNNEIITTGVLRCTNDRIDEKYNIGYSYDFNFTDSKLNKLSYVEATTGDELVDAEDLDARLERCNKLKTMTGSLKGIRIVCSLSNGTLTREQVFDYDLLDIELVTTAYMEAGGEYPGEFKKDSDIDAIERNMKAAGYTCERS